MFPRRVISPNFDGSCLLLAIDQQKFVANYVERTRWRESIKFTFSHHPLFSFSHWRSIFHIWERVIKRTAFCTPCASVWSLSFRGLCVCARRPLIWCAAKASLFFLGACTWHDSFNFVFSLSRLTHRREIEYIWAWPSLP